MIIINQQQPVQTMLIGDFYQQVQKITKDYFFQNKNIEMGGCITPPAKKQKVQKPDLPPKKSTIRQDAPNTLDNTLTNLLNPNQGKQQVVAAQKPKHKKMTGEQFCRIYRIQDNVGNTVRFQGPKYISNYADGIGRVLRVVPFGVQSSLTQSTRDTDVQTRIRAYVDILDLDSYQDEKGNILILQEYYCGPYIDQLLPAENPEQIRRFLSEIHQIIQEFHKKNIVLGNLSISSFRQTSQFDSTVRLVELNLLGTYDQAMGHAFKGQKSMDWESFSFILQTVTLQQPPIFIPHKLQYVQTGNNTINTLYKGKKIKRQELDNVKYINPNKNNMAGYRFRADLGRLLRLRRRRQHHRDIYYSEDTKANGEKISDEALQRLETSRIFERIQNYITDVNQQSQQFFIMHSPSNESLKKLKAIFAVEQAEKKMSEFKETLPLIK